MSEDAVNEDSVNEDSVNEGRGRALSVDTVVVPEHGQWAVDIVVVMDDGVVRRRIGTYRTEALARISANYIRRGADRDIPGPLNG